MEQLAEPLLHTLYDTLHVHNKESGLKLLRLVTLANSKMGSHRSANLSIHVEGSELRDNGVYTAEAGLE